MYAKEEKLIIEDYNNDFGMKHEKFMIMLQDLEKIILNEVSIEAKKQDKYTTALLATSNVKTFRSVVRLLELGYIGDSEVLLRKATESLLMQAFFSNNADSAKEWIKGKSFEKIIKGKKICNRQILADTLDTLNYKIGMLPTEGKKLFKELVYECCYMEGSSFIHLDFNLLHHEITLDEVRPHYSCEFIIGPRYDKDMVKVALTRLAIITSFQTSILCTTFNAHIPTNHIELLNYIVFVK